jgi:hypothetical protein
VLDEEKERGRKLAHLSDGEKDELIAKLMFGDGWEKARDAVLLLMETWGLADQGKKEDEVN